MAKKFQLFQGEVSEGWQEEGYHIINFIWIKYCQCINREGDRPDILNLLNRLLQVTGISSQEYLEMTREPIWVIFLAAVCCSLTYEGA